MLNIYIYIVIYIDFDLVEENNMYDIINVKFDEYLIFGRFI